MVEAEESLCCACGDFKVTELIDILRCKTTKGVVEKPVKHDAEWIRVSRRFARRSALTHRLQLDYMGLMEVPFELFRMKNLKKMYVSDNKLCSLPSEIAQLTALEELWVRLAKRLARDLTSSHVVFQVGGNQLASLPPELGLLTSLKLLNVRHSRQMDLDLMHLSCFSGLRQPAHVAARRNRPAATARAALRTKFESVGS